MSRQGRGQRLRGRDDECRILTELASTVRSGTSQVMVLRGEPGVGKTALLDHLLESAPGFRRVEVTGVESDMELAFAAVHQLCAPLMVHADELPQPQREALGVALGRGIGPTPDRFLVGLAVLSLLAAASSERPVLCVVDDAQWLDQVSAQILAFVARRLLAEPVAVVFAARHVGAEALTGLPELPVNGLSDRDARELLNSVVPGRIDDHVRDRIVAETRGNPLALLEVPRNVEAAELAGGFVNPGTRRSAGQVVEGFAQRIKSLPPDTRTLLLIAAAEPVGDAGLLLRAATRLGIALDALAPAEAAGLVDLGTRVRFSHPLVRSAAYHSADLLDRRAVHRVIADMSDPEIDPDRRAWHGAHAAAGPDETVAADLEASADRARSRGGIAAAAAFFERATALTTNPAQRAARALAAAQAKKDAGDPAAAEALLSLAELGELSDLQRARVAHLRAQMEFIRSRGGDSGAPPVGEVAAQLLDAAQRLEHIDDDIARETYLEALVAAMYAGRLGEPGALVRTAEAARAAVARVPKLTRPIDLLLSGLSSRLTGGVTAGREELRTALERMCEKATRRDGEALQWISLGVTLLQDATATGELWDAALWQRLATAMVRQARDVGALAVLPPALAYRAGVHVFAGEFVMATALFDEASAITAATGYAPLRYHALSLAAWRGDPADAGELVAAMAAGSAARGEGLGADAVDALAAVLYNGLGRYDEAFAAARRACEFGNLGFTGWGLLELTEAATRTGEREVAEHAVRQLEKRTSTSGTDWGLGALASAQALLADNDSADELFTEAIARLDRTDIKVYRARTGLQYGEWLRRVNRRADARRHLNEAHEMFSRMGARAFAERARRELVATGGRVRARPSSATDELTAQESQIAGLARDGLTNQEIGAQLFISTHTVEWHLRKVFAKLNITSRRQLRTDSLAH